MLTEFLPILPKTEVFQLQDKIFRSCSFTINEQNLYEYYKWLTTLANSCIPYISEVKQHIGGYDLSLWLSRYWLSEDIHIPDALFAHAGLG